MNLIWVLYLSLLTESYLNVPSSLTHSIPVIPGWFLGMVRHPSFSRWHFCASIRCPGAVTRARYENRRWRRRHSKNFIPTTDPNHMAQGTLYLPGGASCYSTLLWRRTTTSDGFLCSAEPTRHPYRNLCIPTRKTTTTRGAWAAASVTAGSYERLDSSTEWLGNSRGWPVVVQCWEVEWHGLLDRRSLRMGTGGVVNEGQGRTPCSIHIQIIVIFIIQNHHQDYFLFVFSGWAPSPNWQWYPFPRHIICPYT